MAVQSNLKINAKFNLQKILMTELYYNFRVGQFNRKHFCGLSAYKEIQWRRQQTAVWEQGGQGHEGSCPTPCPSYSGGGG